jgi:hypothetical protein
MSFLAMLGRSSSWEGSSKQITGKMETSPNGKSEKHAWSFPRHYSPLHVQILRKTGWDSARRTPEIRSIASTIAGEERLRVEADNRRKTVRYRMVSSEDRVY